MTDPTEIDVVVIGAGFAGICMAARLKEDGAAAFVVLEKAGTVGGTWRDNTYPGCTCDVPSALYSFSFAPKADWPRMYAAQPDIRQYLEQTVDRLGLRESIRLNVVVNALAFDETRARWRVHTNAGDYLSRFVVAATGPLSQPAVPHFDGIDEFAGEVFHSARWDHARNLEGLRIAVVGTGASAIQLIPEIARLAKSVVVVQRTAPWVMSKADRPVGALEQALYKRIPWTQRLMRAAIYWRQELLAIGFIRPKWMAFVERFALRYLKTQVPEPLLRAQLTPPYRLGCKRILISNDYYPALRRPNVTLATDPIARFTRDGLVTASEQAFPIDVLILATGFRTTELLGPMTVHGRNGTTLEDAWRVAPHAFLGALVPGFPNLFFLLGPNTGLGHNSVIFMIEAQANYVMACLRRLRRKGLSTVEVTASAEQQYNVQLQTDLSSTVWGSGCRSWYQNAQGINFSLWPGFTFTYWFTLRRLHDKALRFGHDASAHGNPT